MIPRPCFDAGRPHIVRAHDLAIQPAVDGSVSLDEAVGWLWPGQQIGTGAHSALYTHSAFLVSEVAMDGAGYQDNNNPVKSGLLLFYRNVLNIVMVVSNHNDIVISDINC